MKLCAAAAQIPLGIHLEIGDFPAALSAGMGGKNSRRFIPDYRDGQICI
jgi:hypothetical protein